MTSFGFGRPPPPYSRPPDYNTYISANGITLGDGLGLYEVPLQHQQPFDSRNGEGMYSEAFDDLGGAAAFDQPGALAVTFGSSGDDEKKDPTFFEAM